MVQACQKLLSHTTAFHYHASNHHHLQSISYAYKISIDGSIITIQAVLCVPELAFSLDNHPLKRQCLNQDLKII
jgi:hypothetical protein